MQRRDNLLPGGDIPRRHVLQRLVLIIILARSDLDRFLFGFLFLDVVLDRAESGDIDTVMAAGRVLMEAGQVTVLLPVPHRLCHLRPALALHHLSQRGEVRLQPGQRLLP